MARDPSRDVQSGYVGSGCRLSGRLNAPGLFSVDGEFVGEILSEDEVPVGNSGYGPKLAQATEQGVWVTYRQANPGADGEEQVKQHLRPPPRQPDLLRRLVRGVNPRESQQAH